MKAKLTFLFVLLFSALIAKEKFIEEMSKNISLIYQAKTIEELQAVVNTLERIGNAEKTRWEPFYYASFGNIMLANMEKESGKKDGYLDVAKTLLDKAVAINPTESEISTLEGFIHTIRLTVDPPTRGAKYSILSMQAFEKALAQNPNNPRALSLKAQMQYGTAKFFGSPTTEACATLAQALENFESYQSENVLAPNWGKANAEAMKPICQ